MEEGDWAQAERLLREVEALAADHPWDLATVRQMQTLLAQRDRMRFGKEMAYTSFRMNRRLTEADEEAVFSEVMESSKAAYLRRKGYQGRSGTSRGKRRSPYGASEPALPGLHRQGCGFVQITW